MPHTYERLARVLLLNNCRERIFDVKLFDQEEAVGVKKHLEALGCTVKRNDTRLKVTCPDELPEGFED